MISVDIENWKRIPSCSSVLVSSLHLFMYFMYFMFMSLLGVLGEPGILAIWNWFVDYLRLRSHDSRGIGLLERVLTPYYQY